MEDIRAKVDLNNNIKVRLGADQAIKVISAVSSENLRNKISSLEDVNLSSGPEKTRVKRGKEVETNSTYQVSRM